MVAYSGIGSKVWTLVATLDGSSDDLSREKISSLDAEVVRWQLSLPESLKYSPSSAMWGDRQTSRIVRRLQVSLYLRANQMRILVLRPVLHSATSIMKEMDCARLVVAIAQDTIQTITQLNQTSNLYETQQVMFNYFLLSALAVLFLAVSHAPAQFSDQCREGFHLALDLVRGFSAESYVAKRLWRTIKHLKDVGQSLGLNFRSSAVSTADPHSDAAVAMAGLAVDDVAAFVKDYVGSTIEAMPNVMANDLSNLFEAAGSYSSLLPHNGVTPLNGFAMPPEAQGLSVDGLSSLVGNEDELSRVMKGLF
jgi:hypothetical protein